MPCLLSPTESLTYAQLNERINRIANVLTRDLGMVPGNRVLLRAPNNPMMVAAYFAVIKAGGVAVATMPLLRAKELSYPLAKAKIALALCDARLADEMEKAKAQSPELSASCYWGSTAPDALETLMMKPGYEHFTACDTASDDVCLIAFTSGTTGEPKGTMHFHRDMLAICDTYAKHVLRAEPTDRFTGSPPLAFTFGLGGLVLFPLRIGASTVLLEKAGPDDLLAAIAKYRITIPFTAPTAYRAMLGKLKEHDISSLRKCVSAGETLPKATFDAWHAATGIKILDGIGATEMLHIFIGSPEGEVRAGSTGRPVPGYEARILDDEGNVAPPGTVGRLAVRGPDRLPLSRRRPPEEIRAGRLERHRRHLPDGCRRLLLVPGALRRHDHFRRLQHRRPGGGVGAAHARRRCRVRRGRLSRRGARPDRQGLRRAARRNDRRRRDDARVAGSREGNRRAVQISTRHRIRHRAAEDADRKIATL